MRLCLTVPNGTPWTVKLEQRANRLFRVTYGKQVDDHLTYSDAAAKLGQAIMHAAACEGRLDNDGE